MFILEENKLDEFDWSSTSTHLMDKIIVTAN